MNLYLKNSTIKKKLALSYISSIEKLGLKCKQMEAVGKLS